MQKKINSIKLAMFGNKKFPNFVSNILRPIVNFLYNQCFF